MTPTTAASRPHLIQHLGLRMCPPTGGEPGGGVLALREDLKNGNNVLHGGAGAFLVDRKILSGLVGTTG